MSDPSSTPEVERLAAEQEAAVARALSDQGRGNDRGEFVEFRSHEWVIADIRNDGNHVHLTLTAPRRAPYRPTTNDG